MLSGLVAATLSALFYGAPAALQARASRRLPRGSLWRQLTGAVRDRLMLAVIACYLLGALCHYVAILLLPLYLAQALVAGSLVFTALASWWLLGERPRPVQWLGLALLVGGIVLLALGAGTVGRTRLPDRGILLLGGAAVACALLGALATRLPGGRGGSTIGLLSGIAYGCVPLAVRGLGELRPDAHTLLAGAVTGLLGLVGFWLYSWALARSQANAATAPLVLAQTAIPALVGIAWLGDGVRPGWWPALAAGLVASLAGTVALSLAAGRLDAPERVLA